MKITYDKEADVLYIRFTNNRVIDSEEKNRNEVFDYDTNNNLVGIEIAYFLETHKKDFFPVFKQIEESVWAEESLATV